jgi:hypothetical protein
MKVAGLTGRRACVTCPGEAGDQAESHGQSEPIPACKASTRKIQRQRNHQGKTNLRDLSDLRIVEDRHENTRIADGTPTDGCGLHQ